MAGRAGEASGRNPVDAGSGGAGAGPDESSNDRDKVASMRRLTSACGSAEIDPSTFEMQGDPATFDPNQVYVHGRFRGSEDVTDAYGAACDDGGASGIADSSSPDDNWRTEDRITVALPCDIRDVRVRVDGSLVYELAQRTVRAFVQDDAIIDGLSIEISMYPEAGPQGDPELVACYNRETFRHWLHPQSGTIVGACGPFRDKSPPTYRVFNPNHDPAGDEGQALAIPPDWRALHLGCDDHMLVQKSDSAGALAVWSPDATVEVPTAFEPNKIAAVRAEHDGFALLIVHDEEGQSPTQLRTPLGVSLWHVSHAGELTRGKSYPPAIGATLDASQCQVPIASPLDSRASPPPVAMDYFGASGCFCALESTGAALCIAREGEAPVVLRFDPGAANAEIVFRVLDDPFLTDIKGLITGP